MEEVNMSQYESNQVVKNKDWVELDLERREVFLKEFRQGLHKLEENIWLDDWQNQLELRWMENMKEKLEMAERKLQFDINEKRRTHFYMT